MKFEKKKYNINSNLNMKKSRNWEEKNRNHELI